MTIKCLLLNNQVKSTDEKVELTYPPLSQPSVQLLSTQSPSCETSLSSSTLSRSTCQDPCVGRDQGSGCADKCGHNRCHILLGTPNFRDPGSLK